jgi:hypothetical protein
MNHQLSGFTSVEESARLLRNYRYAVERMMRILGGWIALTPELSAKLLLGRHVWDNAQHADALGRRLPELRSPAHVSEPANPAFVAFMDAVEVPEYPSQTIERLVGVYRVLKPHLWQSYRDHLAQANAVYEPPTRRILARCADDERRHIEAGTLVLDHLLVTEALRDRARACETARRQLLAVAGGVTGRGLPGGAEPESTPNAPPLSDDAREFIRLAQSGAPWALAGDLESAALGLAGALAAGDRQGARRWLLSDADATLMEPITAALRSARVSGRRLVAVAKIGRQRIVKFRLDSAGSTVTLSSRWVPTADGWRAAELDLVGQDLVRPT